MGTPGGSSGGPAKSGTLLKATSLMEAREMTRRLPEVLKPHWSGLVNGVSSECGDFEITRSDDEGFILILVVSGDEPGSRVEYYKKVDAFGNTVCLLKLAYDSQGRLSREESYAIGNTGLIDRIPQPGSQNWALFETLEKYDMGITVADLTEMLQASIDGLITLDELRNWTRFMLQNGAFDTKNESLLNVLDRIEGSNEPGYELRMSELLEMMAIAITFK